MYGFFSGLKWMNLSSWVILTELYVVPLFFCWTDFIDLKFIVKVFTEFVDVVVDVVWDVFEYVSLKL